MAMNRPKYNIYVLQLWGMLLDYTAKSNLLQ